MKKKKQKRMLNEHWKDMGKPEHWGFSEIRENVYQDLREKMVGLQVEVSEWDAVSQGLGGKRMPP